MGGSFDNGLDFYRQVLDLRGYRQQVLSADIANASTPGFKAVDLDFSAALGASLRGAPGERRGGVLTVSDPRHIQAGGGGGENANFVKYQVGGPVTLDGNSVDLNMEKMRAGENAIDYEAAATFASQTVAMLMTAIKGSAAASSSGG